MGIPELTGFTYHLGDMVRIAAPLKQAFFAQDGSANARQAHSHV
jgi:hypothetical protein